VAVGFLSRTFRVDSGFVAEILWANLPVLFLWNYWILGFLKIENVSRTFSFWGFEITFEVFVHSWLSIADSSRVALNQDWLSQVSPDSKIFFRPDLVSGHSIVIAKWKGKDISSVFEEVEITALFQYFWIEVTLLGHFRFSDAEIASFFFL